MMLLLELWYAIVTHLFLTAMFSKTTIAGHNLKRKAFFCQCST